MFFLFFVAISGEAKIGSSYNSSKWIKKQQLTIAVEQTEKVAGKLLKHYHKNTPYDMVENHAGAASVAVFRVSTDALFTTLWSHIKIDEVKKEIVLPNDPCAHIGEVNILINYKQFRKRRKEKNTFKCKAINGWIPSYDKFWCHTESVATVSTSSDRTETAGA